MGSLHFLGVLINHQMGMGEYNNEIVLRKIEVLLNVSLAVIEAQHEVR